MKTSRLTETALSPTIPRQTDLKKLLTIIDFVIGKGIIMPRKSTRGKALTIHAELRLIRLLMEKFPASSEISYFFEITSEHPEKTAYAWTFDSHRILHARRSWRTGKIHLCQTLSVSGTTRNITFPIRWGGMVLEFDMNGETVLDKNLADEFWKMLIGHSGEGIPKPD